MITRIEEQFDGIYFCGVIVIVGKLIECLVSIRFDVFESFATMGHLHLMNVLFNLNIMISLYSIFVELYLKISLYSYFWLVSQIAQN
jgi:hypothetical protein